ncbi:hypothetical protein A4H97_22850 [Niastella yeongjuensis]|uniref:Peptidase M41 domain-containing protein n=1 Tax=Niastella yeongjuensis TaxID=354355 RepID=A0A1V9F7N3_9BACT|nr:hypothetical protein [Niastella yeongjuensis]OQP54325.1 hypothetical protein A4H97_22850 [Niastella yeongjuensis]SEP30181.1 hypothetical protein SAMN05660816_05139 [Niastella yeongjuensis]
MGIKNLFKRLAKIFPVDNQKNENLLPSNSTDKFYHEAGHVILIKLFEETITLRAVVLNSDVAKIDDSESEAGVRIRLVQPLNNLTIIDHDKAILAWLAGFCVDELVINNRVIGDSFYLKNVWGEKLKNRKYSGDIEMFELHFKHIDDITSLLRDEYISSCLQMVVSILNDEIVWNSICTLHDYFQESSTHTLSSQEIENVLARTGFLRWKAECKRSIIEQREKFLDN